MFLDLDVLDLDVLDLDAKAQRRKERKISKGFFASWRLRVEGCVGLVTEEAYESE